MKLLIDVLGSPGTSGGMRALSELIVRGWAAQYPEDSLRVVGNPWVREAFADVSNVGVTVLPEGLIFRLLGQWLVSGLLARLVGSDVLLSTNQFASPAFSRHRSICVVQDWRHVLRPEEFGRLQRTYRRAWSWSIGRVAAAVQISRKTDRETAEYVASARRVLIELGRDQARTWAAAPPSDSRASVLTFGHHANKRPELVIAAIGEVAAETRPLLVVLGVRGESAEGLARLASSLEVCASFPGHLDVDGYRLAVQRASVVVMASSDEGFGLPVVEAEYFGIPAVVTSDSGLAEIHGDAVTVADPTPQSLGAAIAAQLVAPRLPSVGGRTWHAAVAEYRELALRIASR